jgi:hypothetical protein
MQKTVAHVSHRPSSRRPAPQVGRAARAIPMVALSVLTLACSSATGPDTAPERAASLGLAGACQGPATAFRRSSRRPSRRSAARARRTIAGPSSRGVFRAASPG